MPDPSSPATALREFVYLDADRVASLAAQLGTPRPAADDRPARERLFLDVEPALLGRPTTLRITPDFDPTAWALETFVDGSFVHATGAVRLFDFNWLSAALAGLPLVLKRMSKMEMDALRSSEEGKRMSKTALQQRSQENQVAIAKVEEMKADELGDVVRGLYGDVVRVKVRPRPAEFPSAVLVGSAHVSHFYDSPAALGQKYGVEVDAGWQVVGQLNVPNATAAQMPVPTGNKMEDSFEQIALLMNNAFRLAAAPQFPAVSFTPIAIYRTVR
ncbi:MAG TPA: hypothetical protein VF796_12570 [Humisphaera sp.]